MLDKKYNGIQLKPFPFIQHPFVVSLRFELEPKLRLKIVNKHPLRRRSSSSIPCPSAPAPTSTLTQEKLNMI